MVVLYVLSGIIVYPSLFFTGLYFNKVLPVIFKDPKFIITASNPLTGGGIAVQLFLVVSFVVTLIISSSYHLAQEFICLSMRIKNIG
ncbi:hypothetical protein LMG8526HA_02168 [Lactococcus lactis]|uniref:hypothetical protein n=1 Tax=Lactococcus lactis TaxID=1358 RepID=UPI0028FD1F3A|nr:hypothetical protein [Lactococcus lactis]